MGAANNMFSKILFLIPVVLFSFSCRYVGETVVNSQSAVETNVNTQSNRLIKGSVSQPNENDLQVDAETQTFAKTFVVTGRFDQTKTTMVYTDHLIEFKDTDSKGISIDIDKIEKATLKVETNRPAVRTDFLESNGERLFVLVIGSSGFGSCGDSIFAIAQVNEKLEVKLSETNKPACQGEFYPIKIENTAKKEGFSRRLMIGDLKFDVRSFGWEKGKKKP
jgi:hypothetical protein